MEVAVAPYLRTRFPGLAALISPIKNVRVKKRAEDFDDFRQLVIDEVRSNYSLETLKDNPLFRAYRDFFWRAGIDPTKIRPASEALVRRILAGKSIPSINSLVDSYNLASIRTGIPLAAFDLDRLNGTLLMRFGQPDETFLGIGMSAPMRLGGGEIVVTDEAKLIAVYPYRDADSSKVTFETANVLLMTCGCPGVTMTVLENAEQRAIEIVTRYCGAGSRT